MGRQGRDSTMVSSSIALLQERFRQLERVREKREEKEMLRLFPDSDQAAVAPAIRSCLQPQSRGQTLEDCSLSLAVNSQDQQADFQAAAATTPLTGLWPYDAATPSTSRSFDHSDVDTSLRL